MEDKKAIVKSFDMSDTMLQFAVDVAAEAMAKYTVEKDIASCIKKKFDETHGTTWHCIVGKDFGSFVTHEDGSFIYFYLGDHAIVLFKAG
ncbi:unnamed protein product [Schistosoma turkestanicum]|nr:unnamed protein product [Schistosoma turkestanicum]